MRSRNIKPGFFKNEDLVELDPLVRLLFIGLWCMADCRGVLGDRPKKIKIEVLPADDLDVDQGLTQLAAAGLVTRYTDGQGTPLLAINNFLKHQNPHHREVANELAAPGDDGTTTQAKPRASLGQAQGQPGASPVPALLIPDSGFLIPDSGFLIASSNEEGLSGQACPDCPPLVEGKPKPKEGPRPKDQAQEILAHLNRVTGRSFGRTKDIEACIKREGCTVADCRLVIDHKAKDWLSDPEMAKHLNPTTLFRRKHFGPYLDEAKAGPLRSGQSSRPTGPVDENGKAIPEWKLKMQAEMEKQVKEVGNV